MLLKCAVHFKSSVTLACVLVMCIPEHAVKEVWCDRALYGIIVTQLGTDDTEVCTPVVAAT